MRCLRSVRGLVVSYRDGLLAAAAIASLVGLLAWIATTSAQPQKPNEGNVEAFIPLDAECLVQVRFAEVWNSDFGKLWRETMPGGLRGPGYGPPQKPAEIIQDYFATEPEAIETLLVAQSNAPLATELLALQQIGRLRFSSSPFLDPNRFRTGTFSDSRTDTYFKTDTRPKTDYKTETFKSEKKTGAQAPAPDDADFVAAASPQTKTDTYYYGTNTRTQISDADLPTLLDNHPLAIVTVKDAKAFDKARSLLDKYSDQHAYKGMSYYVPKVSYGYTPAVLFLNGKTMVRAPEPLLRKGIDAQANPPKDNARLAALRKNADKHIFVDWVRGPARRPRSFQSEEELYSVIHQLKPLLAMKSKQVAYTLGKQLVVESHVHFGTPAEAEKAVPALKDLLHLRRFIEPGIIMAALDHEAEQTGGQREEKILTCLMFFEKVDAAMRQPDIKQTGATLAVTVKADVDLADLKAKVKAAIKASAADESRMLPKWLKTARENLRQIGAALDKFDVAHRELPPPAICGNDGKPLLSWRVAILPFLDERALYDEFKLDQPWDSDHNKKLLAKMPAVFASPGIQAAEGHTHYQAVVGKGAGWELVPDMRAKLGARGFSLFGSAFPDGISNTVAVIEATESVPWTKPADLVYEGGKALPKVGGLYKDRVNLLLFDLRPLTIHGTIGEDDLRALITRNGNDRPGAAFWKLVENAEAVAPEIK